MGYSKEYYYQQSAIWLIKEDVTRIIANSNPSSTLVKQREDTIEQKIDNIISEILKRILNKSKRKDIKKLAYEINIKNLKNLVVIIYIIFDKLEQNDLERKKF